LSCGVSPGSWNPRTGTVAEVFGTVQNGFSTRRFRMDPTPPFQRRPERNGAAEVIQLRQVPCRPLTSRTLMDQFARIVVGYHGCTDEFAREQLLGKLPISEWRPSVNVWDWLGHGISF
jgi:hypothetical protein